MKSKYTYYFLFEYHFYCMDYFPNTTKGTFYLKEVSLRSYNISFTVLSALFYLQYSNCVPLGLLLHQT